MCRALGSCLVLILADVGTIEGLLFNGENGLFFDRGDWQELAGHICTLLEDDTLYLKLRDNALQVREQYSFDAATGVGDGWFKQLNG